MDDEKRNSTRPDTPLFDDILTLSYKGKQYVVDQNKPDVDFGREEDNDIVVEHTLVSRKHATVEFRLGKFVLNDHSTNGTYLKAEGEKTVHVHWRRTFLEGSGVIIPALDKERRHSEVIRYSTGKK